MFSRDDRVKNLELSVVLVKSVNPAHIDLVLWAWDDGVMILLLISSKCCERRLMSSRS